MSKPDDIPQGVWDTARELDAKTRVPHMGGYDKGRIEPIARAIIAAVQEEREACAKLADIGQWEHRSGQTPSSPATAVFVGKIGPEIAKDIRNRKEA